MRALRFHGPQDLRLEEVPTPSPGPGEVLVAVEASGVCGSDLHFLDGTARTDHVPLTLGHEVAGTIADPGDSSLPAGLTVVVEVGAFCGDCRHCLAGSSNLCERARVLGIDVDGGLAELVVAPAASVVARPHEVGPGAAATATDAGGTALHAVSRRGAVSDGDAVVVIGVGGLGAYGVQFARLAGASPVIAADREPNALELAAALGADETILVEAGMSVGRTVKMLTDGGADVAIEFVGAAATVDAAVKSLRPGGRAVVVGVGIEPLATLPPVLWSNNEYELVGAYGSLPGDVERVLATLADGSVQAPPLTHVGLDGARDEIMARVAGERRPPGRLIVGP